MPPYLGFGKTALSHLFAPSKVEQTLHQSEGSFGGQVRLDQSCERQIKLGQKRACCRAARNCKALDRRRAHCKRELAKLRALGWFTVRRQGARRGVTQYGLAIAKILDSTQSAWPNPGPVSICACKAARALISCLCASVSVSPRPLSLTEPNGRSRRRSSMWRDKGLTVVGCTH